jgi:predicted RNA methylase
MASAKLAMHHQLSAGAEIWRSGGCGCGIIGVACSLAGAMALNQYQWR